MKRRFVLILLAALAVATGPASTGQGIDLLSSPFIRDGKGNFYLVVPEKTPFDSDTEARKRYLDRYDAGFRSRLAGITSTYSPSAGPYFRAELEGWTAGQSVGDGALIYKSIKSHK